MTGYHALASSDSGITAQAVQALLELPEDQQSDAVALLLADLGAHHDAFVFIARVATTREYPGPSLFWDRRMRAALADPDFPAVADQLGLLDYWKATHTRPDVCSDKAPPPFCQVI